MKNKNTEIIIRPDYSIVKSSVYKNISSFDLRGTYMDLRVTSKSTNSITILAAIKNCNYHRRVDFYIHRPPYDYLETQIYVTPWEDASYTYTGLSEGTSYSFAVNLFFDGSVRESLRISSTTNSIPYPTVSIKADEGYGQGTFRGIVYVDAKGYGTTSNNVYLTLYDGNTALQRLSARYSNTGDYIFNVNVPSKYKQYKLVGSYTNSYGKESRAEKLIMVGNDDTPPVVSTPQSNVYGAIKETTFRAYANVSNSGVPINRVVFNLFDGNTLLESKAGVLESGNVNSGGTYGVILKTPTSLKNYKLVVSAANNHNFVSSDAVNTIYVGLDNVGPVIESVYAMNNEEGNIVASMRAYDSSGMKEAHYALSRPNNLDSYYKTWVINLNPNDSFSEIILKPSDVGEPFVVGAKYRVLFNARDIVGNYSSRTVDFIFTKTKPSPFLWNEQEKNAFKNKGKTNLLTVDRWNQFITNVSEMSEWFKPGFSTEEPNINNSYMNSSYSGRILTANKFNTVRFKIGSMHPTGLNDVKTGDKVYGNYFLILESSLSSIKKSKKHLDYDRVKKLNLGEKFLKEQYNKYKTFKDMFDLIDNFK